MSLPRKAGSCRSLGGSDAAPDEDEAWRKMRLALQTLHRAAGDSGRLVQPEGMALDSLLFLPGESHGQRKLVGYSPWDCKELDTTE